MKKSIFSEKPRHGRWVYALLCVAVITLSAAAVFGYQYATKSIVKDIGENLDILPDIDYSAVDKIMSDIREKEDLPVDLTEPDDTASSLEEVFYEKAIYMPLSNTEVITEFSFGELAKSPSGVWQTHDGVDLKATEGTPVKSMTSGKVSEIYSDELWGNCVVIDHNDALTGYYFGLQSDIPLSVGDEVNAGQIIGYVGQTQIESAIDTHLHFALKYADQWIDPISYIEPYK